jgi:hypothetical protein
VWRTLGKWRDETHTLHGVVLHDDGTLVGRPLPRFRSIDEVALPERTEPFVAVDMVDGIGIYVARFEGENLVWTVDGFEGAHIDVATEMLRGWSPLPDTTVLFEGVFQFARQTVDYGTFEGLILLAQVNHETGFDGHLLSTVAERTGWWGETATERTISMPMLRKLVDDPENGEGWEGFVLVYPRAGAPALRVAARFARFVKSGS